MPSPILHVDLTKKLLALRDDVNSLITYTAGGVHPEIGELPAATVQPSKEYDSGFKFGVKSQSELAGVHPKLVQVSCLALKLSTQDFMILDGIRTHIEQEKHVHDGTSQTMHSMHLPQPDGHGHAVDAVPVNESGQPVWDWHKIYPVAYAFDKAATQLGCAKNIRWGGAWDRRLSDFGGESVAYMKACNEYVNRHPGKDFLDGPHFEWID